MTETEAPAVEETVPPPEIPAGRLVVQYLQEHQAGATSTEIIKHLREGQKADFSDLEKVVESVLQNGTALGFLERKGSQYMSWIARQTSGRKTRSSSRRRRIRRRSARRRKE